MTKDLNDNFFQEFREIRGDIFFKTHLEKCLTIPQNQ